MIVHLIKSVWLLKPQLLREILFVKDGPLAFFGVTAPLHKPMRGLMEWTWSDSVDRLVKSIDVGDKVVILHQ